MSSKAASKLVVGNVPPLGMLHACDIHENTSWNPNDTLGPIFQVSKLYKYGGPVIRATYLDEPFRSFDVMLCAKDICQNPVLAPANDRVQALEDAMYAEHIDVENSPYHGLPFVHASDMKHIFGGFAFDPKRDVHWEVPEKKWWPEVEFDDSHRAAGQKGKRKAIVCQAADCETCAGKEAVAFRKKERQPGGRVYEIWQGLREGKKRDVE